MPKKQQQKNHNYPLSGLGKSVFSQLCPEAAKDSSSRGQLADFAQQF
jgi:hypothetical protein